MTDNFQSAIDAIMHDVAFEDEPENLSDLLKEIGKKIKDARKVKGLSQLEVAKITGISQSNISNIERGKYNMSVRQLFRIASALKRDLIIEV